MNAKRWWAVTRDERRSSGKGAPAESTYRDDSPQNALDTEVIAAGQALRAPGAAAVSGIVFSLLLSASLILIRLAMPASARDSGMWLSNPAQKNAILAALTLVPFAGVAFLWFIGVVRDRMGSREDRLFASVFLGSGLLFIAMMFVASAMAAGLVIGLGDESSQLATSDAWQLGRAITFVVMTTYAMRMAAVFMISTASIALRLIIMPRWIVILGYACALILLFVAGVVPWIELLFPAWVLLVSINLLITTRRATTATTRHAWPLADQRPSAG